MRFPLAVTLRITLFIALIACLSTPALANLLTPADARAYRIAFGAARSSNWAAAGRAADDASERLPAKILHWLELIRSPSASFSDLVDFADQNPDWPLQETLRLKAEEASDGVPDDLLLPYFVKRHPITPRASLRFAEMLAASGQREAGLRAIRELWLSPALDPDTEKAVFDNHRDDIRPEEHVQRLDHLLWAGMESAARREAERVPDDQRRLAEARFALADLDPNADDFVARVPAHLREDPGLVFEQIRWYRRKDLLDQAAQLLLRARGDQARSAWWSERHLLTRRLLDEQKNGLAYDVIAGHGRRAGTQEYVDAEFLAGWIALRRLGEPTLARDHFVRLFSAAKLPISLARGGYWAGRASEDLGAKDAALGWFTAAAKHGTTFYGQLAAAHLGRTVKPVFPPAPRPDTSETAAFDRRELVRAVRMLSELGERQIARTFLSRLETAAKTPSENMLLAGLADASGCLDVAIAAAKQVGSDGVPLLTEGFPVIPVPGTGIAEKSLVLAITRQESSFDEAAVSRSDARGLMQLKPSTAKQVAKSLSLPFAADRLLTDPDYNLVLGRAYLDKMLQTFGGSLVLAIAAYNAGPTRVDQWLSTYGDPRTQSIDVVDWVELLPFGETRNYIQRVLENLQIYRLRLDERDLAFTLVQDLKR